MKKLLVFVVGPTAIGKTSTAIDLATHFNTEIISCDSRQFYKEMNIGTAKPSPNEIKKIKHHLVGNISVNKNYNISEFTNDANNILKSILDKKNIAILVGGSGLYIESLIFGIDKIPCKYDTIDPTDGYDLNWMQNEVGYTSKEINQIVACRDRIFSKIEPSILDVIIEDEENAEKH